MSVTAFLSKGARVASLEANSLVSKLLESLQKGLILGDEFIHSFDRKRKFKAGLYLALWPVLIAVVFPVRYSDRLLAIFCIAAILSETVAALLFLLARRRAINRPEDRLTSWSVAGAAAAGACTIAFLVAAVANAIR